MEKFSDVRQNFYSFLTCVFFRYIRIFTWFRTRVSFGRAAIAASSDEKHTRDNFPAIKYSPLRNFCSPVAAMLREMRWAVQRPLGLCRNRPFLLFFILRGVIRSRLTRYVFIMHQLSQYYARPRAFCCEKHDNDNVSAIINWFYLFRNMSVCGT